MSRKQDTNGPVELLKKWSERTHRNARSCERSMEENRIWTLAKPTIPGTSAPHAVLSQKRDDKHADEDPAPATTWVDGIRGALCGSLSGAGLGRSIHSSTVTADVPAIDLRDLEDRVAAGRGHQRACPPNPGMTREWCQSRSSGPTASGSRSTRVSFRSS